MKAATQIAIERVGGRRVGAAGALRPGRDPGSAGARIPGSASRPGSRSCSRGRSAARSSSRRRSSPAPDVGSTSAMAEDDIGAGGSTARAATAESSGVVVGLLAAAGRGSRSRRRRWPPFERPRDRRLGAAVPLQDEGVSRLHHTGSLDPDLVDLAPASSRHRIDVQDRRVTGALERRRDVGRARRRLRGEELARALARAADQVAGRDPGDEQDEDGERGRGTPDGVGEAAPPAAQPIAEAIRLRSEGVTGAASARTVAIRFSRNESGGVSCGTAAGSSPTAGSSQRSRAVHDSQPSRWRSSSAASSRSSAPRA